MVLRVQEPEVKVPAGRNLMYRAEIGPCQIFAEVPIELVIPELVSPVPTRARENHVAPLSLFVWAVSEVMVA
jgi:hypothetical protein